jgi:hypothetical protein
MAHMKLSQYPEFAGWADSFSFELWFFDGEVAIRFGLANDLLFP